MERETPNGSRYFAIFIDDKTGWRLIYFLKNKSEAADRFMDLIHVIRGETGNLVRIFRTDGGGEWSSTSFTFWLTRKAIRHETSAPHTSQQDGVSERAIRSVTEGTRSCLYDCQPASESFTDPVTNGTAKLIRDSNLPTYLWAETAAYTVYTLNCVLGKTAPVTPHEGWHKSLSIPGPRDSKG